jgi:5-methylcytosine-specific restriction enzyme subunit McrC
MFDETVLIQGHAIRFATVNLGGTAGEIRTQLMRMVEFPDEIFTTI